MGLRRAPQPRIPPPCGPQRTLPPRHHSPARHAAIGLDARAGKRLVGYPIPQSIGYEMFEQESHRGLHYAPLRFRLDPGMENRSRHRADHEGRNRGLDVGVFIVEHGVPAAEGRRAPQLSGRQGAGTVEDGQVGIRPGDRSGFIRPKTTNSKGLVRIADATSPEATVQEFCRVI